VHQYNNAPTEIEASDEFPEIEPSAGHAKKSLKVKVNWPGGDGFHFSVLEIKTDGLIPFECDSITFWVKGSGTKHNMEIGFKDADGKGGTLAMGQIDHSEWTQLSKPIPGDFRQPITISTINLFDWDDKEPKETTCYFSLLEGNVDKSKPVSK
jgi:hypothetical protein